MGVNFQFLHGKFSVFMDLHHQPTPFKVLFHGKDFWSLVVLIRQHRVLHRSQPQRDKTNPQGPTKKKTSKL
jgi:hypothetical protein